MKVIPTSEAVLRQAILTVASAVVAAFILSQLPALRAWIEERKGGL